MTKISLNRLDEKLDNIQRTLDEIRADVKANTEFRLQAKGVLAVIGMITGIIGGAIAWALSKVFR